MTETAITYGHRIKAIRVARSLTQQELADRLGFKRETVKNIESDRQKPTLDFLLKLSAETKLSLDEILQIPTVVDNEAIDQLLSRGKKSVDDKEILMLKKYIKQLIAEKESVVDELQELSIKYDQLMVVMEDFKEKLLRFPR
ncbi:MAG: helix-turn-helix transcriptional regulator [Cyclobacteriaceae bacterium]